MNYNHADGKRYVKMIGLLWDEEFAARVDKVAHAHGITQPQFNVMVREHAWRIKCLFNPNSYAPWQRVLLAAYFLNPFAKKE